MPDILTAADVERAIARISAEMEDATHDLADLAENMAEAEVSYEVAFAKARIVARDQEGHGPKGRTTNDEADDRAIVQCEALLRDHLIKKAIHGACVEKLRTARSQLDALRTIAANIRAQT